MTRRKQLATEFVEFIPKNLDEGILYISRRFSTASHLCCCGCGSKVVTPLNPAKWQLTEHSNGVSLSPSIGLGTFACRSHYWIRNGVVDWYPAMSDAQTRRAQARDEYASQVYTGERKPPIPSQPKPMPEIEKIDAPQSWWGKFLTWLGLGK